MLPHPPEIHADALARLSSGQSVRTVAADIGLPASTVGDWRGEIADVLAVAPAAERKALGQRYLDAAAAHLDRLMACSEAARGNPDYLRDMAYTGKALVDTAGKLLQWTNPGTESPGSTTYIGGQHLHQAAAAMSDAELAQRVAAARAALAEPVGPARSEE